MAQLSGNVALVTGGSRGIGAAISTCLAFQGADVVLTFERAEHHASAVVAEIVAAGRRGLALRADSADAAAVVNAINHTVAAFGRLDILVNSAGIFPFGPLEHVTLDEIDRTVAIHVRAAFVAAQAAARHMRTGGRIISIGSSLAERVPYPGVSLYAMTKAALVGLTKGLARDLGPRGITVNLVHPGSIDTDMNPAHGEGADLERSFSALGTYGRSEDIASMVAYLAGPSGQYITGAAIAVDGGMTA